MNNDSPYISKVVLAVPLIRPILFIATSLALLWLPVFKGGNLDDISVWWPLICIAVNIVTILILHLLMKHEGKSFRDLIFVGHKSQTSKKEFFIAVPVMIVLGIGGLLGFSWLIYGYMPVTSTQPLPVWAGIIVLILLPVTIVFSEIPLFIAYCVPRIGDLTKSKFLSFLYPLFFYALQHSFMPFIIDIKHMTSRFIMFIPLLIMIGIWYSRKKDILPLMAGHGVLDLFTGIQLLMVSLYPSVYIMMQQKS